MRDMIPMDRLPSVAALMRLAPSAHSSLTTIFNDPHYTGAVKMTKLTVVLNDHDIAHRVCEVSGTVSITVPNGSIDLNMVTTMNTTVDNWEDFEPNLTPEVNDALNRLTAITQGALKLYNNRVYLLMTDSLPYEVEVLEHLWEEGLTRNVPVQLTPIKKETLVSNRKTSTRQALIEALTTNMNEYERARMLITSELLGLHHPKKPFEVTVVSDSLTRYALDGTVFKINMFDRSTDLTNVKRKGAVPYNVQAAAAGLLTQDAIRLVTALGASMYISQIVLSDNGVEYYFRIGDSVVFNILFLLEVANEAK